MKRLAVSILALGLVAAAGTASAQSSGYGSTNGYGYGYGQPTVDRYGQARGPYYDYARVLRVDPVLARGYGNGRDMRCESPRYGSDSYAGNDGDYGDDRYYGNDGYRDDGRYRNDGYRNDGYRNDGDSSDGYRSDGYYRNDPYRNGGYRGTTAGSNVATVVGGLVGAAIGSQIGGGSARYATAALGTMVGGMAGRQVYENSHRPRRMGSVQICDVIPAGSRYGSYPGNQVTAYDVTYEYAGRTYSTRTSYNPGDRIRVRVDVSAD